MSSSKDGPKSYERIKLVGRGDVGRVYLIKKLETGEYMAMKVLSKREMVERQKIKRVLTEREILATVHHPNIVTLYNSFQTYEHLFFIMDYCGGGEFFRMLKTRPNNRIPEDWVRFYGAEVLLALEYLHSCGFVYRDLKPENILIHNTGHVMLTDFDLAKKGEAVTAEAVKKTMFGFGGKGNAEIKLSTNSFVGTEEYIAPEVIAGSGQSGAVDWWTFGVLVFEMQFGSTPFKGVTQDITFQNITSKSFKLKIPDDVPVTKNCRRMIKDLLKRDPEKRLGYKTGAKEIKKADFFEGLNFDQIRHMTPPYIPPVSSPEDTRFVGHIDDDLDEVLDNEVPWAAGRGPVPDAFRRQSSSVAWTGVIPEKEEGFLEGSAAALLPSQQQCIREEQARQVAAQTSPQYPSPQQQQQQYAAPQYPQHVQYLDPQNFAAPQQFLSMEPISEALADTTLMNADPADDYDPFAVFTPIAPLH